MCQYIHSAMLRIFIFTPQCKHFPSRLDTKSSLLQRLYKNCFICFHIIRYTFLRDNKKKFTTRFQPLFQILSTTTPCPICTSTYLLILSWQCLHNFSKFCSVFRSAEKKENKFVSEFKKNLFKPKIVRFSTNKRKIYDKKVKF